MGVILRKGLRRSTTPIVIDASLRSLDQNNFIEKS